MNLKAMKKANVRIKPSAWEEFILRFNKMLGREKKICASCRYDWRSACRHTERPNAVWCPDYEKKA
jgi:hypothetical protein